MGLQLMDPQRRMSPKPETTTEHYGIDIKASWFQAHVRSEASGETCAAPRQRCGWRAHVSRDLGLSPSFRALNTNVSHTQLFGEPLTGVEHHAAHHHAGFSGVTLWL